MLKHRHSSFFSGEILQNIPILHFEMLAGLLQCLSTVWWLILQPHTTLWCEFNHYACKKPSWPRVSQGIPLCLATIWTIWSSGHERARAFHCAWLQYEPSGVLAAQYCVFKSKNLITVLLWCILWSTKHLCYYNSWKRIINLNCTPIWHTYAPWYSVVCSPTDPERNRWLW